VSTFSTLSSSVSVSPVRAVLIVPSEFEEKVGERGNRTASVVVVTVVVDTFTEILELAGWKNENIIKYTVVASRGDYQNS